MPATPQISNIDKISPAPSAAVEAGANALVLHYRPLGIVSADSGRAQPTYTEMAATVLVAAFEKHPPADTAGASSQVTAAMVDAGAAALSSEYGQLGDLSSKHQDLNHGELARTVLTAAVDGSTPTPVSPLLSALKRFRHWFFRSL